MKNKRNLNIKWLLLQSDQNADTTLLHSHDDMPLVTFFSILERLGKNRKGGSNHPPFVRRGLRVSLI